MSDVTALQLFPASTCTSTLYRSHSWFAVDAPKCTHLLDHRRTIGCGCCVSFPQVFSTPNLRLPTNSDYGPVVRRVLQAQLHHRAKLTGDAAFTHKRSTPYGGRGKIRDLSEPTPPSLWFAYLHHPSRVCIDHVLRLLLTCWKQLCHGVRDKFATHLRRTITVHTWLKCHRKRVTFYPSIFVCRCDSRANGQLSTVFERSKTGSSVWCCFSEGFMPHSVRRRSISTAVVSQVNQFTSHTTNRAPKIYSMRGYNPTCVPTAHSSAAPVFSHTTRFAPFRWLHTPSSASRFGPRRPSGALGLIEYVRTRRYSRTNAEIFHEQPNSLRVDNKQRTFPTPPHPPLFITCTVSFLGRRISSSAWRTHRSSFSATPCPWNEHPGWRHAQEERSNPCLCFPPSPSVPGPHTRDDQSFWAVLVCCAR